MIKALRRKFILTAMLSLTILLAILIAGITAIGYFSMERTADEALETLADSPIDFSDEEMRQTWAAWFQKMGQDPASDADAPQGTPQSDTDAQQSQQQPGGDNPRGGLASDRAEAWDSREQKNRGPVFGYDPGSSPRQNHFVVTISADQETFSVFLSDIFSVTEEEAIEYARRVLDTGKASGKAGPYKYLIRILSDGGQRVVFLDNSIQARTLLTTLEASCLLALLCLLLMFVIMLVISRRAVKPFAENMERQRQFITNAGHEIKTPLAIIMANTDALELHQGSSRWSQNIRTQAERMSGLVKQLLLLSKADEQDTLPESELLNFSVLVKNAAAAFEEPVLQKHLKMAAEIPDGISLSGNRDGLEQVLSILLDNAVKYTPKDGWISLLLSEDGRKKRLTVRNSVSQLPVVPPDTLFDRFYRCDPARSQKSGGYGIGLSLARAIVEQNHGKIRASYEGDEAICFTLEF